MAYTTPVHQGPPALRADATPFTPHSAELAQHKTVIEQQAQKITALQTQLESMSSTQGLIVEELRKINAQLAPSAPRPPDPPVVPAPVASTSIRLPPGVKVTPPDPYYGAHGDALDSWLFSIEEYFHLVGVTDDASRILYAGNLTRDKASAWYRAVKSDTLPDEYRVHTWAEFKESLTHYFKKGDPKKEARNRLARLKQTGDVSSYVRDFRNIVIKIPMITEDEQLDRFLRGLDYHLRNQVELRMEETKSERLEDAIRIAERLGSGPLFKFAGGKNHGFRYHDRNEPAKAKDGPVNMELNAMQGKGRAGAGERKFTRLTPEEKERIKAANGCVYCREMTHQIDNCPKRKSRDPKGYRPRGK